MLGLGLESSAGRDPRPSGEEIPGPEPGGSQAQTKGRPRAAAGAASRSALCPFPPAFSLWGSGVCETQTSPGGHGLPAWTRPKPQARLPSAPALGHGCAPRMCARPDWGLCSQPPPHLPISRRQPPSPGRSGRDPGRALSPEPALLLQILRPPPSWPTAGPQPLALCHPDPCSRLQSGFCFPGMLGPHPRSPPPRPAPPAPTRWPLWAPGPSLGPCPLSSGWHHAFLQVTQPPPTPARRSPHRQPSWPLLSSAVQLPRGPHRLPVPPCPVSHTRVHTQTRTGLAPFLLLACATIPPGTPSVCPTAVAFLCAPCMRTQL